MAFNNYYPAYQAPFYPAPMPQMQQQSIPDYRQPAPMQAPVSNPASQAQGQQTNGFIWVSGIDEAMGFYVAPNNAVQLWDMNLPVIYKKSADATGRPTMQIFDLVERKPHTKSPSTDDQIVAFTPIDDFNSLRDTVEGIKEEVKKLRETAGKTKTAKSQGNADKEVNEDA